MQLTSLASLALLAPGALSAALLRFSCSSLVTERLDPLVSPGMNPSPHVHQIIGGNSFKATMDPNADPATQSTCTTCEFSQDFSNYWTASLFFRARNGTFMRVPQKGNVGFEQSNGGMTVYYIQNYNNEKVTAFKKGFRMIVGDPRFRSDAEAQKFRQLTHICLQNPMTRSPETRDMPKVPCPAGIMTNLRFPTCWDGKNLDTADHSSHVAYPTSGTFESNGPCPATHPVKIPQLFYETVWDTTKFNDRSIWPEDGSQPFVWSFGDKTGYGNHGDYVFGWKDDSLQKAMDNNCQNNQCNVLQHQSIQQGNQCKLSPAVNENIDGWLAELPGGHRVT